MIGIVLILLSAASVGVAEEPFVWVTDARLDAVRVDEDGRVALSAPMAYVVAPSLVGDDLVYDPARAGRLETLCVPANHVMVALLPGEDAVLVACWEADAADVRLAVEPGGALFKGLTIGCQGTIDLGLIRESGIWHAAPVPEDFYERDAALEWSRPFDAQWITQLCYMGYGPADWRQAPDPYLECDEVMSTFTFAPARAQGWKQAVGWFPGPCWFDADRATVRLGQKVAPAGPKMLAYGLERNAQTPGAKQMPMDIATRALKPETVAAIVAIDDRSMRSVHRAGSVYAQPVCETMDALRDDVFAKGTAAAEKEKVQKVTGDILYYCDTVFGRLAALTEFAPEAAAFCERVPKDSPDLVAFLDETGFRATVETIVTACKATWIADMRPQLVDSLDKMAALPESPGADIAAYDAVRNQIASRVEILDSCAARFDFLLRGVMQKAGYRCVDDPAKARLALELRRLLRKSLKNPTYLEQVR